VPAGRLEKEIVMDLSTVHRELKRIGLEVRHCGPHGLIFLNDPTGGISLEQGRLHFWNDKDNHILDLHEVVNCLSELPAGSGEFAVRRMLSRLAWRG
jgi:hypothetical protein